MNKKLIILFIVVLTHLSCASLPPSLEEKSLIEFEEIPSDFSHKFHKKSFPFVGAAVIDYDGDGKKEIFISGSLGQGDALLSYRKGKLHNIIADTRISHLKAAYGACAIDINHNGREDLLVTREDGLYLYLNKGGKFTEKKIPVKFEEDAVPVAVTVADINRDGNIDIYLSVFISLDKFRSAVFNDPKHAKRNVLLLGGDNLTFRDVTQSSGVGGKQNTFLATFVDLDLDGWPDLVLSQNTGEIEIYRNMKNSSFSQIDPIVGLGFWMGLAIGDYDNDGDQDIFSSNAGNSIPSFMVRGDLRDDQNQDLEWVLLRNEGNFKFTNETQSTGLTGYGFSWGAVFEDLNLDGNLDLMVAQNYIGWPVHNLFKSDGKVFLQDRNKKLARFYPTKSLGMANPFYGMTPLVVDFNNDNRQDIIWVNLDDSPRAFLNRVV
ncbi:MAG: FG-GAP repeat domain-containing protein [Oligoflexales bacterium]